jgi:hypothetical protein
MKAAQASRWASSELKACSRPSSAWTDVYVLPYLEACRKFDFLDGVVPCG